MSLTRREFARSVLIGGLVLPETGLSSLAAVADGSLVADDGRPVDAERLPVELVGALEHLPGVLWVGSSSRALTVYEFFDYNCPYCRKAAPDLHALAMRNPDLRLGIVNNAILSVKSVQAACVHLALLRLQGPAITDEFHRRLLGSPGVNDGVRAMTIAVELGAKRDALEALANSDEMLQQAKAQHTAAADLGLIATPSFVAGTTGILGYLGPRAIARVVEGLER